MCLLNSLEKELQFKRNQFNNEKYEKMFFQLKVSLKHFVVLGKGEVFRFCSYEHSKQAAELVLKQSSGIKNFIKLNMKELSEVFEGSRAVN